MKVEMQEQMAGFSSAHALQPCFQLHPMQRHEHVTAETRSAAECCWASTTVQPLGDSYDSTDA
jgi:hypothetical protein